MQTLNEQRDPKQGDDIIAVTARGEHIPGKIAAANRKGVTIQFPYHGEDVTITSSPFDSEGKKSDSWHWPAPPQSAEAAAAV